MSRSRLYSILVRLHRKHPTDANGLPDAELLERFVQLHDEASFELLVWRHERMVLGVCRRLLRDEHDAEDAFQAAFLTLARKATSIGRREAVASWLYKVAYRCALRVREAVQRQRQNIVRGVDPAEVAAADAPPAAERDDLRELLDEEVQRLPAKYRAAVVLCYLEGKSYQQAAQELGCPAGTLSARLHTAREKLRRRLTARGIAPAAVLVLLESARETHAAGHLAAVAVQAARQILAGQSAADLVSSRTLEIATGVMQTMSASKSKILAGVLLMGCLSGLTGWAAWRTLPQAQCQPQPAETADKPVSLKKAGKAATWQECARLRGAVGRSRWPRFAPDGSALAAFDDEDRLCVWNTSDWQLRWQYRCRDRYGKHLKYFTSFSPDGRLLDVVGEIEDVEKPGQFKAEITLLDAVSGRELARLPGTNLIYSPDKVILAACANDGVTLWDARTFRKLRKLDVRASWVLFSKNASLLCVPVRKGCELWVTATGKKRGTIEGFHPQLSPDGKTMSTILSGGIVKVWNTANGQERFSIHKDGRTGCSASFSADSKRLLVQAYLEQTPDGGFPALMPNRKPRLIPPRRLHPVDVCLYDAATGAELQQLPGDTYDDYIHAELSRDGRTVAYYRLGAEETEHEEVVLWDVRSGQERAVLRVPAEKQNARGPSGVRNPFFSPNGILVRTSDPYGKKHCVWDVATGRRVLDLPAEVGEVIISPDGQWLAGVTAFNDRPYERPYDIRVFHRSDKPLPPPVIR